MNNNLIIPEGLNFGRYESIGKSKKAHYGVECPICHVAVKAMAQKKGNPLTPYFSHFSKEHKKLNIENPVKIVNHRKSKG